MNPIKCRYCLSRNVVEYGIRRNRHTCKQRYMCKRCNKTFVINDGFLRKKFPPEIICIALDLWNRGLSLRQIKYHLKHHHDIDVNHVTILLWLRDYGRKLKEYTNKMKPDLKGNWQADELTFYFQRHHNWLWNVMHKERKYLIESEFSMFRNQTKADKVFMDAKKKGIPEEIQTDGLPNYPSAINRIFPKKVKHVKHSSLRSKRNMNTVERLQGTCRDRLRITRGFHSVKTAQQLWNGWSVYYNYLKPHKSLGGKTPAQVCGVDLNLDGNGWKQLIEKSVSI